MPDASLTPSDTQPHLTPTAAFIQGQKARRRGLGIDANPYHHSDLRPRWRDGWVEEDSILD